MPRMLSSYEQAKRQGILWTPDMISNAIPLHWWDGSDNRTVTLGTRTDSQIGVTAIADKRGGMSMTALNPLSCPIRVLNGWYFLSTNNGAQRIQTPSFAPIASQRISTFMVLQGGPAMVGRSLVWNDFATGEDYDAGKAILLIDHVPYSYAAAPAMAHSISLRNRAAVVQSTINENNTANGILRINGIDGTQTNPRGTVYSTARITMGEGSGTDPTKDVSFYELLWLWGEVPTEIRYRIEGYLAHKWHAQLDIQLHASHPYQKAPPVIG